MEKDQNEDALKEMEAAVGTPIKDSPSTDSSMPAKQELAKKEISLALPPSIPLYLEECNRFLSQMFEELTKTDKNFASYAKSFYEQAEAIGKTAKKDDKNAEAEQITNILIGAAIQGVGKFVGWFKEEKALNQIKNIICQEAQNKLPEIEKFLPEINEQLDLYFEAYDNFKGTYAEGYQLFLDLRTTLYTYNLSIYLRDTFTSALEGHLHESEFPTIYDVNQSFINTFINPKKGFSDQEKYKNYVEAMKIWLTDLTDCTENGKNPTLNQYIFAKDESMMYTAIYDYYPSIGDNDMADLMEDYPEENKDAEDDTELLPISYYFYGDFAHLFYKGTEHKNTILGEALYGNKALDMIAEHWPQITLIRNEYSSRSGMYFINIVLITVLLFLSAFALWDWKWYWSLVVALVGGFLVAKVTPFSALHDIYHLKLTCVNRTIQKTSLYCAGYKDQLNLGKIERKHGNRFLAALLIGILAQVIIPVPVLGFILGAFIGFSMGDTEDEDFPVDYKTIDTGSSWKSYTITVLASLGIIAIVLKMIFG